VILSGIKLTTPMTNKQRRSLNTYTSRCVFQLSSGARNFHLGATARESGDGSPSGVQGQSPGRGSGVQSPPDTKAV